MIPATFFLIWVGGEGRGSDVEAQTFFVFKSLVLILNTFYVYSFIYPPQEIHLFMSWGPFEHLNIYLHYGLPKLGFKNSISNRPLLCPKNFLSWMVDGWWMDKIIFSSFFSLLISDNKHVLIPKMCLKIVYAFQVRSCEHFNFHI